MEGNRPISAPPGPPPQWPPYYPPAKPARRWLPVAIIVAAIIIATAVIAAVLLSRGPDTAAPAGPAPTAAQNAPAQDNANESSSTCEAWPSTKAALNSIPALPAGWNWETPNIDVYVSNLNAAVARALDLFEREIAADDPPQVTEAARTYLSERRQGMERLATRQYSAAADVTITSARAKLDQVCGVS